MDDNRSRWRGILGQGVKRKAENPTGRLISNADLISDHNLRMLPTGDTLHPAVKRLEFGESKPNTGESSGTAERQGGPRIGVGAMARGYK